MTGLCVYIGFFVLMQNIKEGHPLLLIIDEDLLRYDDAVQKCQNTYSGSLLDPKSSSSLENTLRNIMNGPFWVGIQQYYSQFVSHEGCVTESLFQETSYHTSKYASIGYCSTVCVERNSTYFTFKISSNCVCLTKRSSPNGNRCSFDCSAPACIGGQQKRDVYHTVEMEDLQIGIDCMVVECLKGSKSKSYVPRNCFEPAAAACEYDTYLNDRMFQRDMKKKCLDEEKYLASINDDLCQRGYIKNTSYWINPERHVYEAPQNHTGGDAKECSGRYMVFTDKSNRLEIPINCSDTYVHVCVVDDGVPNITVQSQVDLITEFPSSPRSKDSDTNLSQVSERDTVVESNGKPEEIYGPVLGLALIMCTVVVTLFIIQKRRKCHSKNREMDEYGENIHTDSNITPRSNVKDTKTLATNNSKNYSSPIPRESGIYEEQGDGTYDKMNSTRKKKGNEYAENNIYNEASYPDDSNVYNTSTVTAQLPRNISYDTEYGYGKIETM